MQWMLFVWWVHVDVVVTASVVDVLCSVMILHSAAHYFLYIVSVTPSASKAESTDDR